MSPSYWYGVYWIAENDDPGSGDSTDADVVKSYISTLLLADVFGKEPLTVAYDVIALRLNVPAKRAVNALAKLGIKI
jgi:hypothetical protein